MTLFHIFVKLFSVRLTRRHLGSAICCCAESVGVRRCGSDEENAASPGPVAAKGKCIFVAFSDGRYLTPQ